MKKFLFLFVFFSLFFFLAKQSEATYCGLYGCETGEDCYNCSADCGACPTAVPATPIPVGDECTDRNQCNVVAGCNCYQHPEVCGVCEGAKFCGTIICPDGSVTEKASHICVPNCEDPDWCYESPSCEVPLNCNDLGGDSYCASLPNQACGDSPNVCWAEQKCASGGNCYTDCSGCIADPYHWACDGPNCILTAGKGANTCSTNSNCREYDSYSACVNRTCVKVDGSGSNQCVNTSDCFNVIGGKIVNSQTDEGIGGIAVSVYNDYNKQTSYTQTNSSGYWSVSSLVVDGDFYAVRIGSTTPLGYLGSAKTTTSVTTCSLDSGVGCTSYENQWSSHTERDCGTGCNFAYDPESVNPICNINGSLSATVGVPQTYSVTGNEIVPNWVYINYSPTGDSSTRVRIASIPPASFGSTPYPFEVTFPTIGTYFLTCDVYRANPYALCTGHPWCIDWVPSFSELGFYTISQTMDCVALDYSDCGSNDVIPVTVRGIGPWFQTIGGDIQAQRDMSSQIPAGALEKYLSLTGGGSTPGVVGYGEDLNTGEGDASEKLWTANTAYLGTSFGFKYFFNQMRVDTSNEYSEDLSISDSEVNGIYYFGSDLVINEAFPAGKKIIIFVNGNVSITNNLVVPSDSFLAIVSSGNINFSENVTQAQGFFLADGNITVEGPDGGQFQGEGSFVAKNGIVFSRDLGDTNETTPAELFSQRPDLYINAPASFKISSSYFREVEP